MHAKMLCDVESSVKGSLLSAVLRHPVQLRYVAICVHASQNSRVSFVLVLRTPTIKIKLVRLILSSD